MLTIITRALLMLAVIGATVRAEWHPDRCAPDRHNPGPLETFLRESERPQLETKVFGRLEGADGARAIFKGIIAWDPAQPDAKLKGLAIEVVKGACRHTAYVDVDPTAPEREDWLKELLDGLEGIKDKQEVLEYWRGKGPGDWGVTTSVLNGLPPAARAFGVAETVLNIGWCAEGGGKDAAVLIDDSSCGDLHFPNATITEVIGAVSAARAYLWSH